MPQNPELCCRVQNHKSIIFILFSIHDDMVQPLNSKGSCTSHCQMKYSVNVLGSWELTQKKTIFKASENG